MSLGEYRRKRHFNKTPEPGGGRAKRSTARRLKFVIQKHAARRLHYDFRLEMEGVLKSWSVPKGPSLDPGEKRLAVEVEDHPVDYADFEGIIPQGEYGGGTVLLWDRGEWAPTGDADGGLARGRLRFTLEGEKLHGEFALVRMGGQRDGRNWLLIKAKDDAARPGKKGDVLEEELSVASGRSMKEIATDADQVWRSNRAPAARRPRPRFAARRGTSASVQGAKRAAFPEEIAPELATLVDEPPTGPGWIFETKY